MDVKKYTKSFVDDLKIQLDNFQPFQQEGYTNFVQLYNYSGDPGRERNRKRPETIETIKDLYEKSQKNYQSLNNKIKNL